MKRHQKIIALACALLGSIGVTGCYVESRGVYSDGPYASYEYYYYPEAEVYYYPRWHRYYWSEGGTWRWGAHVPGGIRLRTHVVLNVPAPEPWRNHEEIRSRYPHDWHEAGRAGNNLR